MQKLTFLPTLFFICLQSAFSAEVHFSEKADQYTVKLKDIGAVQVVAHENEGAGVIPECLDDCVNACHIQVGGGLIH